MALGIGTDIPGARCDAESLFYSYSFAPEIEQDWTWPARFAEQPEILRYINFVADRLKLHSDIQLRTRITAADYDEKDNRWTITSDNGDTFKSKFFIMASGCLSVGRLPEIEGRDSFKGEAYHTGAWPHGDVDFTGKKVAVIGTGSSGIQIIPEIAKQAKHLTVFQRTANLIVPAQQSPLSPAEVGEFKRNAEQYRNMSRHGELTGGG